MRLIQTKHTVPYKRNSQPLKPTQNKTRAAILAVIIPPHHVAWNNSPGHDTWVLSGQAWCMALVYDATVHARDARDVITDTPATHSIEVNNKRKMVENKKVYLRYSRSLMCSILFTEYTVT
jgi:hypothetical protein